jgi:tetratricopeptide (TPR) repeat protein
MAHPDDGAALCDLGVAYFQNKEYRKAEEALKKASQLNTNDARTMFYLGMAQEYQDNKKDAVLAYSKYLDGSGAAEYRELAEARYYAVTRELIQAELDSLLAQEEKLHFAKLPENTVAVFPLQLRAGDSKYSPLGAGLGEMITIDLAKVKKLRVVERIRTEELLKELNFSASKAVDPTTAPRMGRILAASQVVGGSFNVSGENSLRIDATSHAVAKEGSQKIVTESDNLERLFSVEKEVVFKLINDMGLSVTKEEREEIQKIPTKNLHAFMSYCTGLERERAGDFQGASEFYQQAVALDPAFSGAANKARASKARKIVGPGKENALRIAAKLDQPLRKRAPDRRMKLIQRRAMKLQERLRAGFALGRNKRRPLEDAFRHGVSIGGLSGQP